MSLHDELKLARRIDPRDYPDKQRRAHDGLDGRAIEKPPRAKRILEPIGRSSGWRIRGHTNGETISFDCDGGTLIQVEQVGAACHEVTVRVLSRAEGTAHAQSRERLAIGPNLWKEVMDELIPLAVRPIVFSGDCCFPMNGFSQHLDRHAHP